ncbi:MAG: class II fructose-bisphosphate aldolase [Patescibacteria group bacterium]|nr:class II fructose-bisphosphate aldolase [Patescibacteria group bacterium]
MKANKIDQLVWAAVFSETDEDKAAARAKLARAGREAGIVPASINDFYLARGREELPLDFTVPAINIRGMAYNTARAAFQAAVEDEVGAVIFEIARSEMGYTAQPPHEYVAVITAAALREGWSGPLFIQGDHFQAKTNDKGQPKINEIESIKTLIKNSLSAGFYNIDIDMSTLVDLKQADINDQQKPNAHYSAQLTKWIRELEPKGVTVSVGGEIGHIGGKNSTVEDFRAYIDQYQAQLPAGMTGMSKVSVQTGTHHGGVVLADGSLADVDVDFSILSKISRVARDKYKIGGTVQHGASTLPDEYFAQFVQSEAIEVHLATGFQNIIMDHDVFPKDLLKKMHAWLDKNKADERKPDQTDEQFYYKLRKKAWGEFKRQTWEIDDEIQARLRETLRERFSFMYRELNVVKTQNLVQSVVKPTVVKKDEKEFVAQAEAPNDVEGLAD